jgi:hypothetical protein
VSDALKVIAGFLGTVVIAVVSWLVKTTLGNREESILFSQKLKQLEAEVDDLKKNQVTTECVREVIDEALAKRDKIGQERRIEFDGEEILTEIKKRRGA